MQADTSTASSTDWRSSGRNDDESSEAESAIQRSIEFAQFYGACLAGNRGVLPNLFPFQPHLYRFAPFNPVPEGLKPCFDDRTGVKPLRREQGGEVGCLRSFGYSGPGIRIVTRF